jgi:surface antigen
MYTLRILSAYLCTWAVSACQSTNLGGDIGRDLGNMLGRDTGFHQSGYYGSKVGHWLESEIFSALNARDEAALSSATTRAAETGRPASWGTAAGAHGSATAASAGAPDPAAGASCRIVEQTATLPDGREGKKQVRACKLPDGSWTIKPLT